MTNQAFDARPNLALGTMAAALLFSSTAATALEAPALDSDDLLVQAELEQSASFPQYTVMPHDALDVIYNMEYGVHTEDYVLDVLDEIEINALHHTELGGRYRIRTDGKITLPYKGSMAVTGMTVDELIARLENDYSDIFRDPEIFVKLTEFGAKVEELKRIVSSDRRGQIFETRVRPDGVISLPVVGDIPAVGMTLEELTERVRDAYRPIYGEIGISIILSDSPGSVFYVLGQVEKPGQYPGAVPTTVAQALAMAGVSTTTAGLKNVIVVSMANPARPVGMVLNLEPILKGEQGEGLGDRILARNDVVFVPKTRIAKINQFVNQYITNLVLFNGWQLLFGAPSR
jgi:polysaccharide export outer membrane protein